MPRSTRVVRIHRFGGPEVLEFARVEIPDPGPGEVLLDVEWIGLNRAEILWREGRYLLRPELPAPIGLECAGVVGEVGEGVTRFAQGDRAGLVPATFDPRRLGAYAESIVVPEAALLPTPDKLEGPASAAVWMAYLTAWGGLLDAGGLEEGWHVVIPAASSSVGIAAIQLCLLDGATPIAVTSRRDKVERLTKLGAEHVVVSAEEDLAARVLEITGGDGARLFFDPVGGALAAAEVACAAPGARLIVYGVLDSAPLAVDAGRLIARGLRIEGYLLSRTTRDRDLLGIASGQIVDGLAEGTLDPVVDHVFPFDDIAAAHRHLEGGTQVGKVVVEV